MKEYELFLPLSDNDGVPFDLAFIPSLRVRLLEQFGGVTFFPQPNEGYWHCATKLGKGESSHNVKPFIETLRVTNPVRQSRASSREASLAWGRVTVTAKRRQRDQTLCD